MQLGTRSPRRSAQQFGTPVQSVAQQETSAAEEQKKKPKCRQQVEEADEAALG